MSQPFRVEPAGPVHAYKTYAIASPPDTLVRAACEQVGCPAWQHGWRTHIDETTELGRQQAAYIRTQAGRTYRERPGPGGTTEFLFDSGQRCFTEHHTRPELYVVRGGDFRGNPTGERRQHVRPEDWVDDMQGQLHRLQAQWERG